MEHIIGGIIFVGYLVGVPLLIFQIMNNKYRKLKNEISKIKIIIKD